MILLALRKFSEVAHEAEKKEKEAKEAADAEPSRKETRSQGSQTDALVTKETAEVLANLQSEGGDSQNFVSLG
jgi:hypothetical protein